LHRYAFGFEALHQRFLSSPQQVAPPRDPVRFGQNHSLLARVPALHNWSAIRHELCEDVHCVAQYEVNSGAIEEKDL
jgi:hypothetical protein